jgi:hypothetical protein
MRHNLSHFVKHILQFNHISLVVFDHVAKGRLIVVENDSLPQIVIRFNLTLATEISGKVVQLVGVKQEILACPGFGVDGFVSRQGLYAMKEASALDPR